METIKHSLNEWQKYKEFQILGYELVFKSTKRTAIVVSHIEFIAMGLNTKEPKF